MKKLLMLLAGGFSIYLGLYGLSQPLKVKANKATTQQILPPESHQRSNPSPSPVETPEPPKTVEPTPQVTKAVVAPVNPQLAEIIDRATIPEYYQTNATIAPVPAGYGGWHIRRDPCLPQSCLFPDYPMLAAGYRVKVLDYAGLLDNLGNEWIKVRVFYTNGEIVGYIHRTGLIYD